MAKMAVQLVAARGVKAVVSEAAVGVVAPVGAEKGSAA